MRLKSSATVGLTQQIYFYLVCYKNTEVTTERQ